MATTNISASTAAKLAQLYPELVGVGVNVYTTDRGFFMEMRIEEALDALRRFGGLIPLGDTDMTAVYKATIQDAFSWLFNFASEAAVLEIVHHFSDRVYFRTLTQEAALDRQHLLEADVFGFFPATPVFPE